MQALFKNVSIMFGKLYFVFDNAFGGLWFFYDDTLHPLVCAMFMILWYHILEFAQSELFHNVVISCYY